MNNMVLDLLYNYSFLAVFVFTLVILLSYVLRNRPRKGIPPGPKPRLIFGNLDLMNNDKLVENFRKLRSQYGDVFSLMLGSKLYIIINGYEALREAFVKNGDTLSDRPDTFMMQIISRGEGMLGSSGKIWKHTRTFTIGTLRNFGFGKRSLESRISEEVSYFIEEIKCANGQPFDIKSIAMTCTANVICNIVFGKRFSHNDKDFQILLELMTENVKLTGKTAILNVFPFLRFLPGDRFGLKRLNKNSVKLRSFFSSEIAKHREAFDKEHVSDFIDAFLVEEDEKEEDTDSIFTEDNLTTLIGNLFAAGSETTATMLRWFIVYLLQFPKTQNKLLREIENTVGVSRSPTLNDRQNMPRCESFIIEVLRHANITPLALPHGAAKDTLINGLLIPTGSVLIPNLDSVMSDARLFDNPETFDPDRFIGKDGKVEGHEKVLAFSIGRRICPGEALARMELFLFLTALLQKYEILPDENTTIPGLKGNLGFVQSPFPFTFRAVERDGMFNE